MLKKLQKINKYLLGIIFLACLLRLVGIMHGFPFTLHPDTPTIVRSALGVRFFPNPKHFDWPHLYIYLNYFIYMGFAAIRKFFEIAGLKDFVGSIFPLVWLEPFIFYLITRIFSALLGAFTAVPIYMAGKKMFSEKVGLISALAIAIFPFHVLHSHYGLTDVPTAFLISWVVYFAALIVKKDKLLFYILVGVFVGLAASTKYHGGLSALVIVLVYFGKHLLSRDFKAAFDNIWKPFLSACSALLAFLVGTPFALLDWKTFSRTDGPKGAFWQFKNVGSVSFPEQIQQFLSAMTHQFLDDWSPVFIMLFVFGFFYAVYLIVRGKIKPKEQILNLIIVFVPALAFLFYISGFSKNRSHYYIIAYPFVVLGIGWFWEKLQKQFSKKIGIFLFLIIFSVPLFLSGKTAAIYAREDTRVSLYHWYKENEDWLEEGNYQIYYSTSHFEDSLPERASKADKSIETEDPYLYINECEGLVVDDFSEDLPENIIYHVNNYLRRGPNVCIFELNGE